MKKSQSTELILDCSVVMAWCFEDEISKYSETIFDGFKFNNLRALVPVIWPLEVANVLLIAERKKRLTPVKSMAFVEALNVLSIKIDEEGMKKIFGSISELAREVGLSIYDTCYLELAMRFSLPLATLDKDLIKAAHQMGVTIYKT